MAKFQRHVFVCTNERGPDDARGSCTASGSEAVLDALRAAASAAGLKRIVRVNKAGCLDQCAHGPVLVVYPEAVWYGGVRPEDVPELVQAHLVDGKPVARLVIPDDQLTGKAPNPATPR